jgi:hypothetical protein
MMTITEEYRRMALLRRQAAALILREALEKVAELEKETDNLGMQADSLQTNPPA